MKTIFFGAMRASQATVFAAGLAVMLGLLLAASPAYAKTFTVNSTSDTDDGECDQFGLFTECTLREAINAANEASGQDTIAFNIPGTGVKTIEVGKFGNGQLPPIASRVTIDGYTQPGSSPNTNQAPFSINATPLIELDGTNAGDFASGLAIIDNASNTVIRGLVINDFAGSGIQSCIFGCTTTGSIKVQGNFIGTNAAGTATQANDGIGVVLHSSNDTVGGTVPQARNLISGNGLYGVSIVGPGSKVVGNLIGTSKNGTGALGNGGDGVVVGGSNNLIGGAGIAANVIAFNSGDGVLVAKLGGTGNRILSNRIHSNGELGIDLVGGIETSSGVTGNDLKDPDTGPNNLQNYPQITSVTVDSDSFATITGTLNSRPEKTYTIRFFSSAQADPSGFGEGGGFLGQKKVETNKKGNASFIFSPTAMVGVGAAITATATGGGGTSEFSQAVLVS